MRRLLALVLVTGGLLALPGTASAATCADYADQAAAQRAADTRDADGDGRYCEALPCPCATGGGLTAPPPPPPPPPAPAKPGCARASTVQRISFSAARYPNIRQHTRAAIARGWPSVMVISRRGKDERRERLLQNIPTRAGFDRDEYPAAVGRGRANGTQRGLIRGVGPIGWMADVAYVPSSENRSHGASLGAKLRRFCDGVRFRYVFV